MDEKLILALVAASSAVGGVLVTQAFTLIRELIIARRENKALLREKYELLADRLSESISHKSRVDNFYDKEIFSEFSNKPIENIFTLSILYFPELVESSRSYYNSYREYLLVLLKNFQPDSGLSALMQASKYRGDDLELAVDKLHQSQKNLYETIQKNASKYARA